MMLIRLLFLAILSYNPRMFKKHKLENGLRLVTGKMEGTKAVTVLILAGAGSRYEHQDIRGISHFLEHMFFKGGEKFRDTKAVSGAIDSVGGEFNAFTGKEYAGYYVKVASESVEVAFEVLGDMLLNARFPQEEIEKERGVILEEYNMYQDTPMYQIGWNFEGLIFGDQPLGWDQIGTKELINSVMHEDFVKYQKELYTTDNIVIAVVGNIEHEEGLRMTEKYFAMTAGKRAYDFTKVQDKDGGRVYLKEKKTEQAHLAIGFPGYAYAHKDHFVLKLLSVILGGNMSSRMFLGVREAKGLSYYIHTSTDDYSDSGAISTNAGVDLKRTKEAVTAIIEEYRRVRDEGVPEEELAKAKAYLKGKMVLSLEDSEEFAHFVAKYELLRGGARELEDVMRAIETVKVEDLKRVAEDVFQEDKMKLALIGPFSDAREFEALLKF